MKYSVKKIVTVFLAFVLIASAIPLASADAKTTAKSTKSAKVKTTDVTKKYKKNASKIMRMTKNYYALQLTEAMESGEKKTVKLTSQERQNIAAGRDASGTQRYLSNFEFSSRVKSLFGVNARIASLPYREYPNAPEELVTRYNSDYVSLLIGDWGQTEPVFVLKSITKKGKTYKAVFKAYMEDSDTGEREALGKVVLKLKRNKKSTYGFNITGVTLKKVSEEN